MGICIVQASGKALEVVKKALSEQGVVVGVWEDICSDRYFIKCDLPGIEPVAEGASIPCVDIVLRENEPPEYWENKSLSFCVVTEVK